MHVRQPVGQEIQVFELVSRYFPLTQPVQLFELGPLQVLQLALQAVEKNKVFPDLNVVSVRV